MLALSMGLSAQAAVIDYQVTLNVINVTGATTMGTPAQQQSILNVVNNIWSQAGIEVVFGSATTWDDTDALNGGYSSVSSLMAAGNDAGVTTADPILNVFMVTARPGMSPVANNSCGGTAGLGWNGMAFTIGSSLIGWGSWQTIGYVLAHEIGHNLGLPHPDDHADPIATGGVGYSNTTNLMYSGTLPGIPNSASDNVLLTSKQIDLARSSQFAVAVPEPATLVLLTIGGLWLNRRRRAA